MSEWKKIKTSIIDALDELYKEDPCLFSRNSGRGLAERCIVFRFAHYLQNKFENDFVDCDFNSSLFCKAKKPIKKSNGKLVGRFIDIIIHKRDFDSNLVCFEIKKWNNKRTGGLEKDQNNLRELTCQYGYKYGFHIILGKKKHETTIEVFEQGISKKKFSLAEFCPEHVLMIDNLEKVNMK